jgi:hypothetical protein
MKKQELTLWAAGVLVAMAPQFVVGCGGPSPSGAPAVAKPVSAPVSAAPVAPVASLATAYGANPLNGTWRQNTTSTSYYAIQIMSPALPVSSPYQLTPSVGGTVNVTQFCNGIQGWVYSFTTTVTATSLTLPTIANMTMCSLMSGSLASILNGGTYSYTITGPTSPTPTLTLSTLGSTTPMVFTKIANY